MASTNLVSFVVALLSLVACSAAPTNDGDSMLKMPTLCKDRRFCSVKPEGYDQLEEKMNKALPEFLVKDFADRYGPDAPSEETTLSPKDDWHNCPYETKTQSMYLYNPGGNDTKTDIFVQTKLFRQYVDIVTCATQHIPTDTNEQCFQDLGVSAFHMKSTCVTTNARRTLYVYDIERNKVIQKYFDVPACCKCKVSYE